MSRDTPAAHHADPPATAFIGLGGNLGQVQANLRTALRRIGNLAGVTLECASRFYESEALGPVSQPHFVNAVCRIVTSIGAQELLTHLQEIETELGRERGQRWGPRTLDLDLLFYDALVLQEPDLILPHPECHRRDFVLKPLGEIAPDWVHPVSGKTVFQMLNEGVIDTHCRPIGA